jgi:hypothetical protein
MRKSFDGLCGLIRSELGADPLSGSLFVLQLTLLLEGVVPKKVNKRYIFEK